MTNELLAARLAYRAARVAALEAGKNYERVSYTAAIIAETEAEEALTLLVDCPVPVCQVKAGAVCLAPDGGIFHNARIAKAGVFTIIEEINRGGDSLIG